MSLRIAGVAGLLVALCAPVFANTPVWMDIKEDALRVANAERLIVPERYRTLRLDLEQLKLDLAAATDVVDRSKPVTMMMPLADGSMIEMAVQDAPIMEPGLAARYPDIRTFRAQGVKRDDITARFGWTSKGFHAIVFTPEGSVYIDPYARGNTADYISYNKRDFVDNEAPFRCDVHGDQHKPVTKDSADVTRSTPLNGTIHKTYRLAMAANYEYTQFHSGPLPALPSKAAAMAAIVTTMNRVNGIYERDLAVTMVLVDNNEMIIFDTPADPYVNEDGISMLATNPGVLDSLIGSANYDIGHVFSTGGGGVAGLGVVCQTGIVALGHKANGVTGRGSPIGDPFDVDYVAHEIGHQFGGNHTFNGSSGSCSGGNRNGGTAYEVGSGTTIMAYAGICGAQNTQSNSDDLFHLASLIEMRNYITSGAGNNCDAPVATGNTIPVVDAGINFTIPASTPFKLTAVGTDADGDTLSYAWEQYDLGPAGSNATDTGTGPLFRAFNTVPSPTRTFPKNADFPGGPFPYGEVLPTTNRTMKFRVTARDKGLYTPGAVAWDEMIVTVVNTADFDVDYPDGGETWASGTTETVLWTMTNTDQAPINTALVDILLSVDGGLTYTLVEADVVNDGSHDIVVPLADTSDAVIKVQASNNVYFEISATTFTITAPDSDNDGIVDTIDNCIDTPNVDQFDGDEDGVGNACDNCTLISNPSQCDTNLDGYGNHCDADVDNNGITNTFDLSIMRSNFGATGANDSDMGCNGIVNTFDLTVMRSRFGTAPGPSALVP